MDSIDLSTATLSLFQPTVGTTFSLEEASALTLTEAAEIPLRPHREGLRSPFKLIFTGQAPMLLQGIRHLTHESLGELEIFLVPVAGNGERFTYEAIFN